MSLPCYSASSLTAFRDCPAQYRARYIDKLKGLDTTYGLFGSALHDGLENSYREDTIPHTAFDKRINAELDRYNARGIRPIGYDKRRMMNDGYAILDTFPFEDYKPIDHEYEFFVDFPRINPICTLHGFIDLIDERGWIVDFKSSQKKATQKEIDTSLQLLIYTYAYEQINGVMPERTIIHHLRTHEQIDYNFEGYRLSLYVLDHLVKELNGYDFSAVSKCNSCNLFCPLFRSKEK
jgi:hypothetical protein